VCQVVAAVDDAGTPVGAAVAEWSPTTRILSLAYLVSLAEPAAIPVSQAAGGSDSRATAS
jgi:hypothetical protein